MREFRQEIHTAALRAKQMASNRALSAQCEVVTLKENTGRSMLMTSFRPSVFLQRIHFCKGKKELSVN